MFNLKSTDTEGIIIINIGPTVISSSQCAHVWRHENVLYIILCYLWLWGTLPKPQNTPVQIKITILYIILIGDRDSCVHVSVRNAPQYLGNAIDDKLRHTKAQPLSLAYN